MLANLPENSVELDGYLMGPTTKIMVEDVVFDPPEIRQVDKVLPRQDGIRFGRDYRGGRNITITLQVFGDDGVEAVGLVSELQKVWDPIIRLTPGTVSILRWKTGGRIHRVYGRPRNFAPISLRANASWAPITAEFQCIDHCYYGDNEHSNTVSILPPDVGGFFTPFIWPLQSLGLAYAPGAIDVGGEYPVWPVYIIRGPIAQPEIRIVDNYKIAFPTVVLARDEFMVVDSRPWSRGVRRNNIQNMAGFMAASSPRLSQLQLAPQSYEIVLAGVDQSGQSSMSVAWREVFASF